MRAARSCGVFAVETLKRVDRDAAESQKTLRTSERHAASVEDEMEVRGRDDAAELLARCSGVSSVPATESRAVSESKPDKRHRKNTANMV
jgi:hypothetical protein